jgi:hypothetical protein
MGDVNTSLQSFVSCQYTVPLGTHPATAADKPGAPGLVKAALAAFKAGSDWLQDLTAVVAASQAPPNPATVTAFLQQTETEQDFFDAIIKQEFFDNLPHPIPALTLDIDGSFDANISAQDLFGIKNSEPERYGDDSAWYQQLVSDADSTTFWKMVSVLISVSHSIFWQLHQAQSLAPLVAPVPPLLPQIQAKIDSLMNSKGIPNSALSTQFKTCLAQSMFLLI